MTKQRQYAEGETVWVRATVYTNDRAGTRVVVADNQALHEDEAVLAWLDADDIRTEAVFISDHDRAIVDAAVKWAHVRRNVRNQGSASASALMDAVQAKLASNKPATAQEVLDAHQPYDDTLYGCMTCGTEIEYESFGAHQVNMLAAAGLLNEEGAQ